MYKLGDILHTTKGLMIVQCPITFKENTNPKYDKLGGLTLFWLQNEQGEDVFLWEDKLNHILISDDPDFEQLSNVEADDEPHFDLG